MNHVYAASIFMIYCEKETGFHQVCTFIRNRDRRQSDVLFYYHKMLQSKSPLHLSIDTLEHEECRPVFLASLIVIFKAGLLPGETSQVKKVRRKTPSDILREEFPKLIKEKFSKIR